MPVLLAIGAAYSYYKKKNSDENSSDVVAKKIPRIDPTIKLKGKIALSLHLFEKEISIIELPITTISFFNGNYCDTITPLRNRVEEIIQKNPWLMGRLLPMPDTKILYDPNGHDRPPSYFTVYKPECIPLNHTTPYGQYNELLRDAMVLPNSDLIGQNKPLWKLSIIPDAIEPTNKFALLVSMSHVLGDAHSYYKIYNMLNIDDSAGDVVALNPVRVPDYVESVHRTIGASETNYVHELIVTRNPSSDIVTTTSKNAHGSAHPRDPSSSIDNNVSTYGPALLEEVEFSRVETPADGTSSSTKNAAEVNIMTKMVRTIDLIDDDDTNATSSEMDTSLESRSSYKSDCEISEKAYPPTIPSEEESLFQSFVQHQQQTNSQKSVMKMFCINDEWVVKQRAHIDSTLSSCSRNDCSTLSTNSIISSWFFRANKAVIGILMMNLRGRICNVTDLDFGNYAHALVCTENEIENATNLHYATQRVGFVDQGSTQPTLHFDNEKKASMCVNWINFYRKELCITEKCKQTVHIPIYDTNVLQYLPDKVSVINLFTVNSSPSRAKFQTGAFVVCQEAVWKEIERSCEEIE
jgi:hypothetical protein